MNNYLIIFLLILLQSCTILSKNEYYSLNDVDLLSRDDGKQIDCYEQIQLIICSKNLHSKSLSFGVLIPVIPTFGRLGYDVKNKIEVSMHNTNSFDVMVSCTNFDMNCLINEKTIKSGATEKIQFKSMAQTKLIIYSGGEIIGTIILIPKTRYDIHPIVR